MDAERKARVALWSVGGVGPQALEQLHRDFGPLAGLLEEPIGSWLPGAQLLPGARRELAWYPSLEARCDEILEETQACGLSVCFPGDPAWPEGLTRIPSAPPLLWHAGPGARAAPRRRVAMVGTRTPEQGFRRFVTQLIRELVIGQPIGVVSGLARGIDQWCHAATCEAGAETWAFLGSGLGALDGGLWRPAFEILDGGGTLFSEFPPLKRADKRSFPRRNRLISGASEVVLMLRGDLRSGALYTVTAALAQGRPVLAVPGDPSQPKSAGCNLVLQNGHARACLSASDLRAALGLPARTPPPATNAYVPEEALTEVARSALAALSRQACDLEEVQVKTGLDAATASTALSELELLGLVLQLPGRLYERV